MPDRASFWSSVPEWAQATLAAPGLAIRVREHAALWLVSGNTSAFLRRHAIDTPLGPRDTTAAACFALRLAPDRLLFVSDAARADEFGWTREGCAISDMSDGLVCIELVGAGAIDLLRCGSEYAFESTESRPHESAQLLLAGFRVIVARRADGWRLYVERPWAAALWRWLEQNRE